MLLLTQKQGVLPGLVCMAKGRQPAVCGFGCQPTLGETAMEPGAASAGGVVQGLYLRRRTSHALRGQYANRLNVT